MTEAAQEPRPTLSEDVPSSLGSPQEPSSPPQTEEPKADPTPEETPAASKDVETDSTGLRKRKDDSSAEETRKKDAAPVEARRVGAKRPAEHVQSATSQAVEFCKHPEQLVPIIRTQLDTHVPHNILLIFLFIWTPLFIIAAGSVTGQLIVLIFRHIHFLIGIAAAIYVWQLHVSGAEGLHSRFLQIFLIASILPIFMIEESNFFLRIFTLIAFSGAPFLLNRYFRSEKKSDDVTAQQASNERFLSAAAAPAVIYAIAVGGTSFWNALAIAPFFGIAALLAYRSVELVVQRVEPFVPEPYRLLFQSCKLVVFAVEGLLIANILLAIASWILIPQSILDEQSGTLGVILTTFIGIIFFTLGHVLGSADTLDGVAKQFKLPASVVDLGVKAFTGVVVASFGLLLVANVLKLVEL